MIELSHEAFDRAEQVLSGLRAVADLVGIAPASEFGIVSPDDLASLLRILNDQLEGALNRR